MLRWTVHLKGPKGAGGTAVTVGHDVYFFGGVCHGATDQINIHVFNTVSFSWTKLPPVTTGRKQPPHVPPRRWGHAAVLIDDVVYIWGGYRSGSALIVFDVDTHRWFKPKVSGTVPKVRQGHSACALGKVMFMYGGWTHLTGRTNEIYRLDTAAMVWSLINTGGAPAPASTWHSATIIGTKMFVFGGPGHQDNNIRVFDTETNCWLTSDLLEEAVPSARLLPEDRWGHLAFAYNGELYICGGRSWNQYLHDLWIFKPETFSWTTVKAKGKHPCWRPSMCSSSIVGDRVVILFKRDLYILDVSPSLKTLCKLVVIQCGLEQSGLPHNIRWELAAMTTNSN